MNFCSDSYHGKIDSIDLLQNKLQQIANRFEKNKEKVELRKSC